MVYKYVSEDTYRGTANDPLSLNLYTYCVNNPLRYFDPTGHEGAVINGSAIDNTNYQSDGARSGYYGDLADIAKAVPGAIQRYKEGTATYSFVNSRDGCRYIIYARFGRRQTYGNPSSYELYRIDDNEGETKRNIDPFVQEQFDSSKIYLNAGKPQGKISSLIYMHNRWNPDDGFVIYSDSWDRIAGKASMPDMPAYLNDAPLPNDPYRDTVTEETWFTDVVAGGITDAGFTVGKLGLKQATKIAGREVVEEVVEETGKLSSAQIANYLSKAIKNPSSNGVVLGTTGSYDVIAAERGYTYFKMTDEVWNDLVSNAAQNYDEIWKVNEAFIDEQINAGKEILLSNNPTAGYFFEDGSQRFFQREIDYLTNKGYKFEMSEDGLWKAIK